MRDVDDGLLIFHGTGMLPMAPPAETRLSLLVRGASLRSFCLLTGSGFAVGSPAACTLPELLCGRLGVEPAYLETRIQTIFLNFKVVDDPSTAMVAAGSTLGLSGAMPGIAGAIVRKASRLSSMRSKISHDGPRGEPAAGAPGDVTVRLFNVLQEELGPGLLERGIRIPGRPLGDLLHRQADVLRRAIEAAEIDGEVVAVSTLFDTDWDGRNVWLQVRSACSS